MMVRESKNILIAELIIILFLIGFWLWTNNYLLLIAISLLVILSGMTLYFFRDPDRSVPTDSGIVLAPADGRVIGIRSQEEKTFCQSQVHIISIFLSLWDVHVNRIPVDGTIKYLAYRKGRFHPAFHKKSYKENEQMLIGIESGKCRFLMRQVAGMIARRIVCHVQPENQVYRGQRFGMIKMGSLVELAMPISYKIAVKKNQHVKAGETIIGIFESEK